MPLRDGDALAAAVLVGLAAVVWVVDPRATDFFVPKAGVLGIGAAGLCLLLVPAGSPRALLTRLDPAVLAPLLAWVVWNTLSALWARQPRLALDAASTRAALVVFVLSAATAFPGRRRTVLAAGLAVVAALPAALALAQWLGWNPLGVTGASVVEEADRAELYAASSTVGHKNLVAGVAATILPLSLALAWAAPSRRTRIGWGALALPSLLAAVALQSRGAWVALAAVLAVALALLVAKRTSASLPRVLGFAAALLGVTLVLTSWGARTLAPESMLSEQLGPLTDWSSQRTVGGRVEIWAVAARMASDHPLWGVGSGNFSLHFLEQELERLREAGDFARGGVVAHQAHNDVLQAVAETGLVGGVLWLWFCLAVVRLSWTRFLVAADRVERALLLGAGASWIALLAHSTVDFPFQSPANAGMGMGVVALLLAPGAGAQVEPGPDPVHYPGPLRTGGAIVAALVLAGLLAVPAALRVVADHAVRDGTVLLAARRYAEADRALQRANRWSGGNGRAFYTLGRSAEAQGRLREAASLYRQSLSWNDHHIGRRDLGLVLARVGQPGPSAAMLADYLWIHPGSSPRAFLVLGAQLLKLDRREEAIQTFIRCNCPDGSYYAAELLREDGRYDDAAWRYRQSATDRAWSRLVDLKLTRQDPIAAREAAGHIADTALRREAEGRLPAGLPPAN